MVRAIRRSRLPDPKFVKLLSNPRHAFRSCFAAMHSMAINIDKADHIPKGKLFHLLRLTGHLFSAQPLSKLRPIIRKIATFATDEDAAENCVRAVAALGSGETAEGGQAKESYEMTEETI